MCDKDLIYKVCSLTCSKQDLCIDYTTVNYDTDYPFNKYYNVNTIIGAIKKYLSKQWDDKTLANWCCWYNWILCGGFNKNLKENLNPLEEFLKGVISDSLDGLSFFDEDFLEGKTDIVYKWLEEFKNLDYILQTQKDWVGFYSTIGQFDYYNGEQHVVLINDSKKEYIIIFSENLKNNYKHQSKYLKFTSKNKFVKLFNFFNSSSFK